MIFRRKTIAIVEDEADTAEMFSEMMRLNGYEVVQAASGSQAISQIASTKPDLVVMDLMLPEISGMEVIQQMQRDPSMRHIPVVIVSARSMMADIQAGLDAGAISYLTKPVSYSDLLAAIQNALGRSSPSTS